MESDRDYFERRATEARAAALAASDERARGAHLGMAERYEDLSAAIGANDRHLRAALTEAA